MGSNDVEETTLIDPACGMPVSASSPHSCVRGGAMFYFCSETCRSRFLADPLNFVVMSVAERDMPAPVPSALQAYEEPSHPLIDTATEVKQEYRLLERLRGLIASWILARKERRYAERASDELLALYRTVCAAHPRLCGRDLYREVVMARTGCDLAAANVILDCAEESFAAWPVSRELALCDVIHYLSVSEFIADNGGERWMHTDINLVVKSIIPHQLCVEHRKK